MSENSCHKPAKRTVLPWEIFHGCAGKSVPQHLLHKRFIVNRMHAIGCRILANKRGDGGKIAKGDQMTDGRAIMEKLRVGTDRISPIDFRIEECLFLLCQMLFK